MATKFFIAAIAAAVPVLALAQEGGGYGYGHRHHSHPSPAPVPAPIYNQSPQVTANPTAGAMAGATAAGGGGGYSYGYTGGNNVENKTFAFGAPSVQLPPCPILQFMIVGGTNPIDVSVCQAIFAYEALVRANAPEPAKELWCAHDNLAARTPKWCGK